MKITTAEELIDALAADLAWRKKELSILRSSIRSFENAPSKQEAMIRSGVTVLYAHWEGFIKYAAEAYLHYVAKRKLKYSELKDSFCALAIRSKFINFSESRRFELMLDIATFFIDKSNERSNLIVEKAINTRSNLSSKVLKEILLMLSLDFSLYATKDKLIDESLLHLRNNIAHGKELFPNVELVEDLFDEIIGLLNLFKNQVENAAITKAYLKSNQQVS